MSPGELLYRSGCTFRDIASYIFPTDGNLSLACGDPWEPCQDRNTPQFYFAKEHLLLMRQRIPESVERISQLAESLCLHKFTFFDLNETCLGPRIDWHYNVKDKKRAPRWPAMLLDYRDAHRVGDVKYIWEINRHQHLIPLALAFSLTGEERYALEATGQIQSWIADNPFGKGINWTSALEAGLRLISWSWVFALIRLGGKEIAPNFFCSIAEHCAFIHTHFSLFSSRGNHLIGEAAGLFIASLLFATEPCRSRWLRAASKILVRQIQEQVHLDGTNCEQSTGYHLFTTDLFLLPALLGRRNHIEFPRVYWDRLERMFHFIHALRSQTVHIPDLGDNDAGQCLLTDTARPDNAESLLTTGALFFNRRGWLEEEKPVDVKTFLLLAQEGIEALQQQPGAFSQNPVRNEPLAFPDAGYYVIRAGREPSLEIFLLFDCGPMGMEPLAGHGHADTLSFYLSVNGSPIFIDPGTYTYRSGNIWRDYFRGTSSHNTIRIDERNVSVSGGNFLWIKKANGKMLSWRPEGNTISVEGAHDGYAQLKDPVLHCRKIHLKQNALRIKIKDTLKATHAHRLEAFFHLDPSCEVNRESNGLWIYKDGTIRVHFIPDPRWELQLVKGQTNPILGWYSPHYGKIQPTYTILGKHTFIGDVTYSTEIRIEET